ncbi:particle subunit SRP68 [Seminavis robusta]|uniref:Signal recognition particle subunit SRP68 n=1 Tax=Seminavis robusta TaxID=568900 RepID=A0A9N8H9G7_9STRA|nr:particle subunit SRP68 [Seminavis robusta]|eukprot:Sro275_g105650.1 particle subunit SRP68 (588) ;mRNA; r:17062-18825
MTTTGEDEGAEAEQPIFSLSIFETLSKSQNSHGVMHEDYHEYHQYCTNRLYRLRHAKPVRRDLVHNSKYVEGVQLRRNAYCSRKKQAKEDDEKDEDAVKAPTVTMMDHENHLWVPLYQAERAWAQACEIQRQKRPTKTQQLVLRKLRKAVKFATTLQDLSVTTCTDQTKQEIESYVGWIQGNYALQKQEYAQALTAYRSSMSILLTLAQQQKQEDGDPRALVLADLWTTRAESVLRPLVRFCQYEAKDTSPDPLEETTAATSTTAVEQESEIVIHFRGKHVPLDPYKDLCVLHLKAEALQKQQPSESKETESSFLSLLSLYDDATAVIEEELARYQSIQSGPAVNAKKEELGTLAGYFQYQKLNKSLHKNQERLAECHSDAERVHVYDALLQNAQAIAQIDQEDEEANAHVLRIRALRCCELAKVYLVNLHQPASAKALWKQAMTLTKRATEELAACDTRDKQHEQEIDAYLQELEDLQTHELAVLEVRWKAALFLQKSSGTATGGFTTVGTDRPLWMRLEEFDPGTGGSLVDNPPRPIPMPCKSVFYDTAWKYCGGNFPVDELEEEIEKQQPKQSGGGGLFGWLTG